MAPKKTSLCTTISQSPISIGNCEVLVEATKYACNSDQKNLQISLSRNAKIRISVKADANLKNSFIQASKSEEIGKSEKDALNGDEFSFLLVNPKDVNNSSRSCLQEVLEMYTEELPTMKFAANTGKQSTFLERCVMNGKYCTLLFKSMTERDAQVVAAITYQIVPADTQYAEIPLAAVHAVHQRKGVGRILFAELRKRLQSVGVRSIICWGDKESEGFWHKQGFISVAEVDVKGRTRRLPIKADIRKALCFPGGSTLMISHLDQDIAVQSVHSLKLDFPLQPKRKLSSGHVESPFQIPIVVPDTPNQIAPPTEISQPGLLVNESLSEGRKKQDGAQFLDELKGSSESKKVGVNDDVKNCCCSTQGSGAKRVWEASLSSLKSKKVKGSHLVGCQSGYDCKTVSESSKDSSYHTCPSNARKTSMEDPCGITWLGNIAEGCAHGNIISQASTRKEFPTNKQCFNVMLMNIADGIKKANLIRVIVDLGGTVTCEGSTSTHVITGKVRATLNFCTALCSGAWVVSPCWLKESFRQGRFVDELPYTLNDEEYTMKYRDELKKAVMRAKANPGALLGGYDVCLASHGQSSVRPLSTIIKSAGANVIGGMDQVNEASKTIFVAHEDDMEEAMLASRKGVWTFNCDWLMNCIMRQELDFEAPQFAESL